MSIKVLIVLSGLALCLGYRARAIAGEEVTIKGNILSNVHTGEKEHSLFLLAYDGTPAIKTEFDKIVADHWPAQGLDADAARKLQDQFMTRLLYRIDGPLADKLYKDAQWTTRTAQDVTGVVAERDGKRWLTVSKAVATKFAFPAKMLAADKPLVTPDQEPLTLKISDRLSLKCPYVPSGKFLIGEPYYQCPHWQEDPPHLVKLTKAFYMSEIPITQEIYEAVVGVNPSRLKGAQLPVHNVSCADAAKFCKLLAEKNGRKIRVPTNAEWEYAARVGTSNPTFPEKYAEQNSNASEKYDSPPLPVKSKKPNAWGFYDMHSGWWERVADAPLPEHADAVDPFHVPPADKTDATRSNKHQHVGKGQWTYAISEIEYISSEPGDFRFRIVVETEPNDR